MLYQLSYTPKASCRVAKIQEGSRSAATCLSQSAGSLAATPEPRKAIQAAARLRFSPSSAFTVVPDTGLEKI
jgi:hypothetical protein